MTDRIEADGDRTGRSTPDLPVVTAPATDDRTVDGTVAGVLLAAGTSSRFGAENKLLATVEGEPIVRRAARTLLSARTDPVVVVLGHDAGRIEAALDGLPLDFVRNDAYASGQATSVRTGIEAVRARVSDCEAVVVALGDMPYVSSKTVDDLVAAHQAGLGDALAPAYEGMRGNPVLFDRRFFDRLTTVTGDVGGRRILLEADRGALVAVDDSGVHRDVDTPSDL